jgi:hypothetical protein
MTPRCDRRVLAVLLAASSAALGACSDGNGMPKDSMPDMPIDSMCGAGTFFTGEIIDWDSTDAKFCGVYNSKLTVFGQSAPADTSRPNGRFELCVPHQALTEVDVAHGTNQSQCTTPAGVYPVRAVLFAEQAVIDAGGRFSARAMTQQRQDDMFTAIGVPYSAAKAQLVVHVDGAQRQVAISAAAAHDTTQKFDGAAWAAGDTGSDVFFPNVDPGSVQIAVTGNATGSPVTVTLAAGAYTYVAARAN